MKKLEPNPELLRKAIALGLISGLGLNGCTSAKTSAPPEQSVKFQQDFIMGKVALNQVDTNRTSPETPMLAGAPMLNPPDSTAQSCSSSATSSSASKP